MNLPLEEIEKIGKLARIRLTGEEKSKMQKELSPVISYFEKLQALDTSGIDLHLAETENTNRTRLDFKDDSGIQQKILANAPLREDDFIRVKSVF